jgi:DegV family protein with EDD domain
MAEIDRRVAIVTDTGSSITPKWKIAKDLGVTIVPLEVMLWENGAYVPHPDSEIDIDEFYKHMRTTDRLPQTSGAVMSRLIETYRELSKTRGSIMSIHITAGESAAYSSAVLAKNTVIEEAPSLEISVVDSKQASIAEWFCVEAAAKSALMGATIPQLNDEVEEVIKKTQVLVTLDTFDNLRKGGRGDQAFKAFMGATFAVYPVITFVDGKLNHDELVHGKVKSRKRMLEMVGDAGKLTRAVVIHTNAFDLAETTKQALMKIFPGDVPIIEAGPALAVHAGEGAIGIAFQRA